MTVQQEVLQLLPARRKSAPSGWISFNAPCCVHNGETADTRGRGGIINSADGAVSYHCFNCGFKTSWRPGWHISYKFRKLLRWFGADDNTIQRLVIEALQVKDTVAPETIPATDITALDFATRLLPPDSASIRQWATLTRLTGDWDNTGLQNAEVPEQLMRMCTYLLDRGAKHFSKHYDFYTSDDIAYNMHRRVIIPFIWKDKIIGYTARAMEDGIQPKFHSSYEPNFVFNINNQQPDYKFVIVCEGPFDAMSVDGVAVLSNNISETQADIIDGLARQVIVVPDFDVKPNKQGRMVWSGKQLVDNAIEYGWAVSFPIWRETCKDINEALVKYGKLFTLKAILDGVETNRLKIELMKKKIHN